MFSNHWTVLFLKNIWTITATKSVPEFSRRLWRNVWRQDRFQSTHVNMERVTPQRICWVETSFVDKLTQQELLIWNTRYLLVALSYLSRFIFIRCLYWQITLILLLLFLNELITFTDRIYFNYYIIKFTDNTNSETKSTM